MIKLIGFYSHLISTDPDIKFFRDLQEIKPSSSSLYKFNALRIVQIGLRMSKTQPKNQTCACARAPT